MDDGCDPPCSDGQHCEAGSCVDDGCDPPCAAGQHCDAGSCTDNVCDPPCNQGETCVTHGGSECVCTNPPCGTTPCTDGVDNDADGWVDAADPDCASGQNETGFGNAGCNDGIDNDGDGAADADDPECVSGGDDEVLGSSVCADVCVAGAQSQGRTCRLWDSAAMAWIDAMPEGDGHLHNRARSYIAWLRNKMMPEGGVFRGQFSDADFTEALAFSGTRDSPIWTGTYLASEALRYEVTGAPDAAEQMKKTVDVIDLWWHISGDRGYLARYAVPANSPPVLDQIFDPDDPEDHRDFPYQGSTWHWKGDISRDQYQGVMLGYAAAYDATDDPDVKETIRANVTDFAEVLMTHETRAVEVSVNGFPMTVDMDLGHAVYTDDETPNGVPTLAVTTDPFELVDDGFTIFWPNPSAYLRQIPGLGWLPDIYLRSQAIQLASIFRVALHVTEGVPAYAARRQALEQHYEMAVQHWMDIASGWENTNDCGDSYHGLNIAFQPAYNWVRLETDPTRKALLQTQVLRDAMWSEVWDHKNVFFAYIYASQAHPDDDVTSVVASHTDQLRLFPTAPYHAWPVDNTSSYAEDPQCSGLSTEAIDVDERVPASFLWEKNPWRLSDAGTPNFLFPGVDYLITYWMARYHGYLDDDAPGACLQWQP